MTIINRNIEFICVAADKALEALDTNASAGLSNAEVEKRLKQFGTNTLSKQTSTGWLFMLAGQFKSPIIWLLFIAAGLSAYFGEWLNSIAIAIVILINCLVGFFMEYQADKSMAALKRMSVFPSKVIRNGKLTEINADYLVPGDVVYIEAGDVIPADGRMISSFLLTINETALTGESMPVEKSALPLPVVPPLAERNNMLFRGTFATAGNGYLVVTTTGMQTELGQIAQLVQSAQQAATPLEKKLEGFSKKLIMITVALVFIIFIVGILNGQHVWEMLETAIALAVAAIPEGLPIVATISLARGMIRMSRQNVIVKKLSAVETLGGTNVICTDKTGTLTENQIEVKEIITAGEHAYSKDILIKIAVLCNTAELDYQNINTNPIGDPLEVALLKFAGNSTTQQLRSTFQKIEEIPFSSETKRMSTLHVHDSEKWVFMKGAPEQVLECCRHIQSEHGIQTLSGEDIKVWLQKADDLALQGFRMIAGAYKKDPDTQTNLSQNLTFAGLYVMIDPPRKEVYQAVDECKSAGIRIVMITGDHPSTANYVARDLRISDSGSALSITGAEMKDFEDLTETDKSRWMQANVFARVSPKQKLDLISVLQENHNVVGMTGDGINDAPALKKADIGIAMGLRGTQVSQEVADMVLKDDSFNSIVLAIKQGRIIFENIRKFVIFLLSCNLSELLVIATASILNLHFQLVPLQILFINLITDILPALALGMTDGNASIMKHPPRKINEPIIDKKRWNTILIYALIIALASIGSVYFSHFTIHKTETWNPRLCNNMLFFTLIFSQLLHVYNMGNNQHNFLKSEVFRNKQLAYSIGISIVIVIGLYLISPIRNALDIHVMTAMDWFACISFSLLSFFIIQLLKWLNWIKQ